MNLNIHPKANNHWSVKVLVALEAIALLFLVFQIVKHSI